MFCPLLIFLGFLNVQAKILANPVLELNEDLALGNDHFINNPLDALVIGDKLYLVGGSYQVLVFKGTRLIDTIGQKGEGPKDFRHWPEKLEYIDRQIVVTEMYGWSRSFFTPEGEFIRKEALDKNFIYLGDQKIEKLHFQNGENPNYRLKLAAGCYLGKTSWQSDLEFHSSSFLLVQDKAGNFIFVRRNGVADCYDNQCHLLKSFPLKVGDLGKDPVVDKVLTKLNRIAYQSNHNFYEFGTPIFDAEMDSGNGHDRLWLLASNEYKRTRDRRPGEVWMLCLNLHSGEVDRLKLPGLVSKIRIFDEKLVLISARDATVKVFRKKDVLANL